MKVILTGSTGTIGGEVLQHCLRNPAFTSIIALQRRPFGANVPNDPKLKVVILKDFSSYPEDIIEELRGADACIWYIDLLPSSD